MQTLFDKIWERHVVAQQPGAPAILYIDLHLVHEVTSPQAFAGLQQRGLRVRRPERTVATMDHSISTAMSSLPLVDEMAHRQMRQLETNCAEFGITLYGADHPQRGIVHVIGPELGLTQPGMTIVCGDSHTATHGAFGALAFGIGTSEVEHVLATQCLLQTRPLSSLVNFDGCLPPGVTAKDLILALIAQIGIGGGTGQVFEYSGEAVRSLDMEGRMTLCNMSIEAGARAGMIAPDEKTFEYLVGRPYAPQGMAWEQAMKNWQGLLPERTLPGNPEAAYDRVYTVDASRLEPMITYGTNPGMAIGISQPVPDPQKVGSLERRQALEKALRYMDLPPGRPLLGHPVDVVFIGSCTNARLSDLREAAAVFRCGGSALCGNGAPQRKIAENVRLLVVPGSEDVRRQAEAEGLDQVFLQAGGEWRRAGCSMCIAMNGDQLQPGEYAVSTSNRNFEGRQGPGGRTFLASPATAAAAALTGKITDPRTLL